MTLSGLRDSPVSTRICYSVLKIDIRNIDFELSVRQFVLFEVFNYLHNAHLYRVVGRLNPVGYCHSFHCSHYVVTLYLD